MQTLRKKRLQKCTYLYIAKKYHKCSGARIAIYFTGMVEIDLRIVTDLLGMKFLEFKKDITEFLLITKNDEIIQYSDIGY